MARTRPSTPFVIAGAAVSALAACVPQVAPPPIAAPRPTPVVALPPPPPLATDWRDWPRTPGDWRYTTAGTASHARYEANGVAALTIACDRAARRITLTRPSRAAATVLTVRTTSTTRALPVQASAPADAAPLLMLNAALAVDDRVLDAMAFSRGRFAIDQAGQPPLVLPGWAELGRVIQDCR